MLNQEDVLRSVSHRFAHACMRCFHERIVLSAREKRLRSGARLKFLILRVLSCAS